VHRSTQPARVVHRRLRATPSSPFVLLLVLLAAAPAFGQAPSVDAAERLLEAGRHAEAKALLQELARRHPSDAHIANLAGWVHVQLGEADAAVRELERAVRLAPRNPLYHVRLGESYALQLAGASTLRQRAIADRMRGSWERALELDPSNVPARARLVEYHLRAPAIAGGDARRAREHADALHTYNDFAGKLMLSMVHQAAGDMKAWEATLLAATAAHPDSVVPRGTLAQYFVEQARYEEAWNLMRPLVEAERPLGGALYVVGRISAVSGRDLDRGERALREYLRRTPAAGEPPLAAAHTRLGDILRHRGDIAGARREYETALRLDPNFEQARDALRQLR
jgi:tetratricopeptide (TPR) repeat protein